MSEKGEKHTMFTGIVQGRGTILEVTDYPDLRTLRVRLPELARGGVELGASIAHNGCCLTVRTVEDQDAGLITVDLIEETLQRTNLGALQAGDEVNIERSLRFGDEIGGHVLSGHILGVCVIEEIVQRPSTRSMRLSLPATVAPYALEKGFIAVDGCSLTLGEVAEDGMWIHLIPETLERTLFGSRQVGDVLNVEVDGQTQAIVDTVEKVLARRGVN